MGRWFRSAPLVVLAAVSGAHATDAADFSQLKPCPVRCQDAPDPSLWTLYNSVERLTVCKEPTLFEVSLSAPLESISDITAVRACTAGEGKGAFRTALIDSKGQPDLGRIAKRNEDVAECTAAPSGKSARLQLARRGGRDSGQAAVSETLDLLHEALTWSSNAANCQSSLLLGHLNGTFMGYTSGPRVEAKGTLEVFNKIVSSDLQTGGVPDQTIVQHCGVSKGTDSTTNAQKEGGGVAAGLVVSRDGDFGFVHSAMRLLSNAKCVQTPTGSEEDASSVELPIFPFLEDTDARLENRQTSGTCKTIQVVSGDGCASLAQRCKISGPDYEKYNNGANHCSTLMEGQHVCCSSGKLPDFRPSPNADGSCKDYTTKPDDFCAKIAVSNGLALKELSDLNKNTWGWSGCEPLGLGITLCLSKGTPPMPAAVDNAVCGPTKPGSRPPRADQTMADLNPCLLNACCNIWGQCGLTDDFCTIEKSKTGAPGTSGHRNGCIQNCGTSIINNSEKPAIFRKLGYFEGWNFERKCLRMDVEKTMQHYQRYTDIHFAFAEISASLDPYIPTKQMPQWRRFVNMKAPSGSETPRKIVAFGGWTFSTEPATYRRFPDAVSAANRVAFARKVVDFAVANKLDGIDFDWEYPGAPDLPGLPAGGADEGPNYYAFLQEVRKIMPKGMSLSIAAPSSYWYLKAFPIGRMASVLDYIVYMTYDLHGQWDWDNEWSSPGCPGGNCLRSHVNDTETEAALAMITKAGVPAHKVLVGVASYGRSFKMTTPGCTGPDCTFVGDKNSPARKGECTDTGGYLALAEIKKIIKENPSARHWTDANSGSNIMVYNSTEWVGYMDDNIRRAREAKAMRRNFGGTIEWAVDLQDFIETNHGPEGPGGVEPDPVTQPDWKKVTCTTLSLTKASNPRQDRWKDSLAESAWFDVARSWEANKKLPNNHNDKSNLPFPEFVSDFFNNVDHMQCHTLINQNQCHGKTVLCDETRGDMRPAGWQILNSFAMLNGMFWNLWSSIDRVKGDLSDRMDALTAAFIPPKKEGLNILIILDILSMGYATAMAPLWNKVFKPSRWGQNHPGGFDTLKDFTNDMTYQGITLAKDVIALEGVELSEGAELKEYMRQMATAWQKSITAHNSYLFSGGDGLKKLHGTITRGNVLTSNGMNADDLDGLIERSMYAMLIPTAWRLADRELNPFIVDTGVGCGKARSEDAIKLRLTADAISSEMICDDSNDRAYFLLASEKPKENCKDIGNGINQRTVCEKFQGLPGTQLLKEGGNSWGNITMKDIVLGSVETFKANGHKNKEYKPDNSERSKQQWKTPMDAMQDDDYPQGYMRAPGIFDLPICHVNTALVNSLDKRNWSQGDRGWYFPCEEVDPRIDY